MKKNTRKRTSEPRASKSSENAAAVSEKNITEDSANANSAAVTESSEKRNDEAAAPQEDGKKKSEKEGINKGINKGNLMTSAFYGIAVLLSALLAFWIRIIPRDHVFMEDGFIRFMENDPWYHWRNTDFLLHNFPHFLWFDPATTYPFGTLQEFAPLYDYILVIVIKTLQLITGNTTEAFAMTVAAYWPAVLAGFCVVAVYFVAKTLFNSRNVGLLAAFLLAIAPGQFLGRSLIGFNDHHVAEVLFSSLVILYLVMALLKLRDKKFTYDDIFKGNFSAAKPFMPYAILAGIMMAAYTLVWEGALLFGMIIGVYVIIQMVINHLRGESTAPIAVIGITVFLVDLLLILPVPHIGIYKNLHIAALIGGMIVIFFLAALSYVLEKKDMNKLYYPGILAGLAIGVAVIGSLISSTVRGLIWTVIAFFSRTGGGLTIGEATPFFGDGVHPYIFIALIGILLVLLVLAATSYVKSTRTKLLMLVAWTAILFILILASGGGLRLFNTFSVMGFIWIFALPIIAYIATKDNHKDKILLVIWVAVLLWAMVQQNRFSYYFVVPAVILTSWLFMEVMRLAQANQAWEIIKKDYLSKEGRSKKAAADVPDTSTKQEKAKTRRESSKVKANTDNGKEKIVIAALVLVVGLGILVVPTYQLTSEQVHWVSGPNEAWIEAS